MTAFMLNLFGKNDSQNFRMIVIILPSHIPQAAILGLANEANNIYNLLNHILLVFKYCVYRSRGKHILNIDILMDILIEIKKKGNTC